MNNQFNHAGFKNVHSIDDIKKRRIDESIISDIKRICASSGISFVQAMTEFRRACQDNTMQSQSNPTISEMLQLHNSKLFKDKEPQPLIQYRDIEFKHKKKRFR